MKIVITLNDGGRSESTYRKEKNDCTVRSIANAFEVRYDKIYKILEQRGRQKNRGSLAHYQWLDKHTEVINFDHAYKGKTLSAIFDHVSTGTYLIEFRGHITCIKEGCFHDDHFFLRYLKSPIVRIWFVSRPVESDPVIVKRKLRFNIPKE